MFQSDLKRFYQRTFRPLGNLDICMGFGTSCSLFGEGAMHLQLEWKAPTRPAIPSSPIKETQRKTTAIWCIKKTSIFLWWLLVANHQPGESHSTTIIKTLLPILLCSATMNLDLLLSTKEVMGTTSQSGQLSLHKTIVQKTSFLTKLRSVLSLKSIDHIVSWLPEGKIWRIHEIQSFKTAVLPLFYEVAWWEAFLVTLRAHGFKEVSRGMDSVAFYNEVSREKV